MSEADWVRITILDDLTTTIVTRDVEDPWYRTGGYRHPTRQQQARDELAAEELREWLRVRSPRPGAYVIWVAELHRYDHRGAAGKTWARIRIHHHARTDTNGDKDSAC